MPGPLDKPSVLLAASYPAREFGSKADSQEIAAAVKGLIGAVFQRGWAIVFGGHPTISPLILMIAREFGRKEAVTIYQSKYFIHHIGAATLSLVDEGFGEIALINNDSREPTPGPRDPVDPSNCPLSLAAMRKAMVKHPGISGLVLIGGDSGLQEEFELFRGAHPNRPAIPFGSPGGAARELLASSAGLEIDNDLRSTLSDSRNYLALSSRIVGYISARF